MFISRIIHQHRIRQRVSDLKRLVKWWKEYPEGVIFTDDHLHNFLSNYPRTKITKETEIIRTVTPTLYLPQDKNTLFNSKVSSFTNYLIDSEDHDEFYFANCYLFLRKYYIHERNQEKINEPSVKKFKIRPLSHSDNLNWLVDTYVSKNIPIETCVKKIDAPLISLSNNCNINYFHWMHFPSLINYSTILRKEPSLLRSSEYYLGPKYKNKIPSYIHDTLEYLKIGSEKIHFSSVQSNRILSCFQHTFDSSVSPKHLSFLRKIFVHTDNDIKKQKRIFVSRIDASVRKMINEDEVYEMLKLEYDFTKVVLGSMNLETQAQLFANADIIIGPHGAGMGNIVFAKPEATVIELFSTNHINPLFHTISSILKFNYGYILGMPLSDKRHGDYTVSTKKVKQLMKQIL